MVLILAALASTGKESQSSKSLVTGAAVGKAVRHATLEANQTLTFDAGTVDFSPERGLVSGDGENAFPPTSATPGSVGDADYSPLVKIDNAGGSSTTRQWSPMAPPPTSSTRSATVLRTMRWCMTKSPASARQA
ncbi:MAG TPA: hypothetical protein VFP05_13880 [Thermomicrobiales bacterium]|nr:hypothetical protein [Thermomicrobiales bacterium]